MEGYSIARRVPLEQMHRVSKRPVQLPSGQVRHRRKRACVTHRRARHGGHRRKGDLPPTISYLKHLRKLDLSGNNITSIPESIWPARGSSPANSQRVPLAPPDCSPGPPPTCVKRVVRSARAARGVSERRATCTKTTAPPGSRSSATAPGSPAPSRPRARSRPTSPTRAAAPTSSAAPTVGSWAWISATAA